MELNYKDQHNSPNMNMASLMDKVATEGWECSHGTTWGWKTPKLSELWKNMIRTHFPTIWFLSETKKCDNEKVFSNIVKVGSLTNIHSISCNENGKGKVGVYPWCGVMM